MSLVVYHPIIYIQGFVTSQVVVFGISEPSTINSMIYSPGGVGGGFRLVVVVVVAVVVVVVVESNLGQCELAIVQGEVMLGAAKMSPFDGVHHKDLVKGENQP